jgi:hypothetical protein
VLDLKVNFPKSNMTFLETKLTFPANFGEKYDQFFEKGIPLQGEIPISGAKNEGIVYGLNGKPLTQLNLKLKDGLTLIDTLAAETPWDLLESFEVKYLSENKCPIKAISFAQEKPNTLTVCRIDGCQDESMQFSPVMKICLSDLLDAPQQFLIELEEESKMFNFIENVATRRYTAHAILDTAAKVAIVAMTKNGGQGDYADLSDLNGFSTIDDTIKNVILTNSSIRADQNGQTTVELEPNAAKDIMPVLGDLIGNRIVSGCTADTNICVFNFASQ